MQHIITDRDTGKRVASRLHPLMAGAAAGVILVSLLGTAAITGLVPSSRDTPAPANGEAPYAALVNPPAAWESPARPADNAGRGDAGNDAPALQALRPAADQAVR